MMLAVNLARYGHSEEIEERRDVSLFFPVIRVQERA